MRKIAFIFVAVALVGAVALAVGPSKAEKVDRPANVESPDRAPQTIDYWGAGGAAFYSWNGDFYMSNLFKPTAGWYPLAVTSLDVMPARLDGLTGTGSAGVLDGVGVFDTAGGVLSRELAVAGSVNVWMNVPLSTPPQIATGNFYGGLWNGTADGGLQTTASNWTAPPTEPFNCLNGTGAAAAGPFTPSFCGDQYGTVSAASVIANVNTNIPDELMVFEVQ
ncbi:MAG: hypothetical protein ABFS37_02375 [Acidobacteriota bacterium]